MSIAQKLRYTAHICQSINMTVSESEWSGNGTRV